MHKSPVPSLRSIQLVLYLREIIICHSLLSGTTACTIISGNIRVPYEGRI